MTQTFRSRDEQVGLLSNDLAGIRCPALTDHQCALRHIAEAEARGAAEERGKVAEGDAIYMWRPHDSGPWYDCTQDRASQEMHKRILYSRPSNVADLEARIAELEGIEAEHRNSLKRIQQAIQNDEKGVISDTLWMPDGIETVVDHIDAALKREGGV